MNDNKQKAKPTYERGQEVVCAWPGCENRTILCDLALVAMVNILPPGVRLGIAKPGGFWLCIGGKGLYCDRHRRMITGDKHQELERREES